MGIEEYIFELFQQYAYQPYTVYAFIVTLMVLSSFGLPIPEEVTLVSTGFLAYIGTKPDLYPPPYEGAPTVDAYTASIFCLLAVFISDYLIFLLGKYFGPRILQFEYFKKNHESIDKVRTWIQKYGFWAAGIFRFTPGIRFPGHFSCGMMGVSSWKFFAVDGTAALFSVPTQVILVSMYGKEIIDTFREYTFILVGIAILAFAIYAWKTRLSHKEAK